MAPSKRSMRKSNKDKKQDMAIAKINQFLKNTIETKITDFRHNASGVPVDVSVTPYRALAFYRNANGQGTGDDDRIGNKVTLLSQTFNIELLCPAAGQGTEDYNKVRLLIVENTDFDDAYDLELTDVLEYGDWTSNARHVFISPYKKKAPNNRQYKVHMDKVFTLNLSEKALHQVKFKIDYRTKKKEGKVLKFNTALDTIPANHRMVMFAISDSASANHPQIGWICRNKYKDA